MNRLYQRRPEFVSAYEVGDHDMMMVELIPSSPEKLPLPTELKINEPVLIHRSVFDQHYYEVPYHVLPNPLSEPDPMSDAHSTELAEIMKEPLVGVVFDPNAMASATEGAEVNNESTQIMMLGGAVNNGILSTIPGILDRFRGVITLQTVLWAAETAFNFGIKKIPFPIPESIKTLLWNQLESAIRNLWDAQNTVTGSVVAPE